MSRQPKPANRLPGLRAEMLKRLMKDLGPRELLLAVETALQDHAEALDVAGSVCALSLAAQCLDAANAVAYAACSTSGDHPYTDNY